MRFRPTNPCGKFRLILRNASGLIGGERVFLRQALETDEAVRGYDHLPEMDYHLIEELKGHYNAVVEGGLYDIYRNDVKWSQFSPVYIPPCDFVPTSGVTPGVPAPTCVSAIVDVNPMFCWSVVAEAFVYDLEVATDVDFTNIVISAYGLTDECYTYSGTLADGTYYWRVRAENSLGTASNWSAICTLEIVPPIDQVTVDCVSLITAGTDVTFSWDSANGALTYHIQIASDSGFTSLIADVDGIATTSYHFGSISTGIYYWRVRGEGLPGVVGDWSATCTVAVPFFDILTQTSTTVTVEWGNLPLSTVNVRIERTGDLNSDTPPGDASFRVVDTVQVVGTPLQDINLLPGGPYTYHLVAIDALLNETTPVADVSGYTNPEGAMADMYVGAGGQLGGGGMDETSDRYQGAGDVPDNCCGLYYGGGFDHSRCTVQFVLKNTGQESDYKTLWGRAEEEDFGPGAFINFFRIKKNGTGLYLSIFSTPDEPLSGSLPQTNWDFGGTGGTMCPLGETHTFTYVFDLNKTQLFISDIYVYKDNVRFGSYHFTGTEVRSSFVTEAILFGHWSKFEWMRGVEGVIDEFRVWSIQLDDTLVGATYNKIVRNHPYLVMRQGFDNFENVAGIHSYPKEFDEYGAVMIDPPRYAPLQSDPRVVSAGYEDRSGRTLESGNHTFSMKHIVEPLVTMTNDGPSVPVLISPANNSTTEELRQEFAWVAFNANSYQFQLALDTAFTNLIVDVSGILDQKYTPAIDLNVNTTYYWRVRSSDGITQSAYSAYFTLTTPVVVSLLKINVPSQLNVGTTTVVDESGALRTVVMNNMDGTNWNADGKRLDFNGTDEYLSVLDSQFRSAEMVGNADSNNRDFATTVGNWAKVNANDTLSTTSGGSTGNALKLLIGSVATTSLVGLATDVGSFVVGQSYHLEMKLAFNTSWNGGALYVTCGGVSEKITLTSSYQDFWMEFVAASTSAAITITCATAPTSGNILRIDTVSLTTSSLLNLNSGHMIYDVENRRFDTLHDWTLVGSNMTAVASGSFLTLQTPTAAGSQTGHYLSLAASKFSPLVVGRMYSIHFWFLRSSGGTVQFRAAFGASGTARYSAAPTSGGDGVSVTFVADANDVGQDLRLWLPGISGGGTVFFENIYITEHYESSMSVWFKGSDDNNAENTLVQARGAGKLIYQDNSNTTVESHLTIAENVANNPVAAYIRSLITSTVSGGTTALNGNWHKVDGTFSFIDGVRAYFDGSQVGAETSNSKLVSEMWMGFGAKLFIGCSGITPATFYHGGIGFVEVVRGRLTSALVASRYTDESATFS